MLTLVKRAFLKSMNNEETLLIKAFLGLRRCYVDYVIAEYQVGGLLQVCVCVCVCVRHPPPHDRQIVEYSADDIKSRS